MASNDEKKLTVRLPEHLHERIATMAKADRRSLNAQLVRLLEEAVEARAQGTSKSRPE